MIDCINDLEFAGGEKVLPWAEKLAGRLVRFRGRARRAGMPVIYVNDNFGMWRDNFEDVVRHCERRGARGAGVSRRLRPGAKDYFILKPRHSAFYATSLVPLLEDLGVTELVLAGMATNLCVLFSAHDAHMRQYKLTVLSDCCAAESDFDHDVALKQLERFCGARVCLGEEYRF
jgi:nicotinamidase-related amidase